MLPTSLWSTFATARDVSPEKLISLVADEQVGNKGLLSGGSGGVRVFKAPDGKRYTLKTSNSPTALKDEIFADAVYQKLGFNVPSFSLFQASYNELPTAIKAAVPKPPDETETVLFRLADYIEPNHTLSEEDKKEIIKAQLPDGFLIDCYLANTDIAGHWKNVLIDENDSIWRIDNGSTLRFRAKGEMKSLRTVVDELTSMKSQTEMMREVFGDISSIEIQKQVKALLEKRNILIELFLEMQNKIGFDQPEMLLKIIVNRLQYLHEHASPELYPYAPSFSEACLDYSGAGILLFSEIEGRKHVLLGKRVGHDWWGSFGGGTDEFDLFLKDTAARESNEELMDLYKIQATELDKAPSHDLIIEEKLDLNVPKFRMYFVERKVVEATVFNKKVETEKLTQHEHDEFIWAPVDAILSAKTLTHDDKKYGAHQTLEVNILQSDNSQRTLPLHPPFAMMLQQDSVRAQLESLAHGKKLDNRHTRSRLSKTYPAIITKDVTKADEITPMAERYQLARTTVQSGLMKRNLKQQFSQRSSQVQGQMSRECQSDIHFRAIMSDKFQEQDTPQNKVDSFDKSFKKIDDASMSDFQRQQFSKMLQEEAQHPNQCVFYHAGAAEIGFLYDVFTEFRKQLEHQYEGNFQVLRAFDDLFAQFKDVTEFMAAYSSEKGHIDNYDKDYQEMGLSVNPFPFGSDGNKSSATYYYFLQSKSSKPPDIEKLFHYFVSRLQIDVDYSLFNSIFKQFREKAGGVCYQIFVDRTDIDKVAYAAKPGGAFTSLQTAQGEIKTFSGILEELRKNPIEHAEYIQKLQARLFLKPEIFHDYSKVEIKTYQAQPLTPTESLEYQYALSREVSHCMTQLMASYRKLPDNAFASGKPSLHRQMSEVYKQMSRLPVSEVSDVTILIPLMLEQGNTTSLKDIILTTPLLDLSQSLPARNYTRGGVSSEKTTLLGLFNNYRDITRQVFTSLQSSQGEPHVNKVLTQLKDVILPDMIVKKELPPLIDIIVNTPDLDITQNKHMALPNTVQEVFYNHTDIARQVFSHLLKSHQDKSHIPKILNQLRPVVIFDMIEQESSISDLIEIMVDTKDLDLSKSFVISDYMKGSSFLPDFTLLYFFNKHLSVARKVFSGLASYLNQPHVKSIFNQLKKVVLFDMIVKKEASQLIDIIVNTPDLDITLDKDIAMTHTIAEVFYNHTDIARHLFSELQKSHQDKPHIPKILNQLRPIVIFDMIEQESSISDLIEIMVDTKDLDLSKPFIISDYMKGRRNFIPNFTLLDFFNKHHAVARKVFSGLEPYKGQPHVNSVLNQLKQVVISDMIAKNDASELIKILLDPQSTDLDLTKSFTIFNFAIQSESRHNLLDLFEEHPEVAMTVFSALQKSNQVDPRITKTVEQLRVIAWYYYASMGDLPQVEALFDETHPNKSEHLFKAIHLTAIHGKDNVLDWLLEKSNALKDNLPKWIYNTEDITYRGIGKSSLVTAVTNGHSKIVEKFLSFFNNSTLTSQYFGDLLWLAAEHNHPEVITVIIEKLLTMPEYFSEEVLIKTRDLQYGRDSILCYLAEKGHSSILETVLKVKSLSKLVSSVTTRKKMFDLVYLATIAIENKQVDVLQILLKYSAEIRSSLGGADLLLATKQNHIGMVNLLLPYMSYFNETDDEGKTSLMVAAENGNTEIIYALLNNEKLNTSEYSFEYFLKKKTKLENLDALALAVRNGHFESVRALLTPSHPESPIPGIWNFRTALQLAKQSGHAEIFKLIINSEGIPITILAALIEIDDSEAIKNHSQRIKTAKDFRSVNESATPEARTKIYELFKDSLPDMITNNFVDVFEYLTPEQCLNLALKKIKTAEDFRDAMKIENQEKRTKIYESFKNSLPNMIKENVDYYFVFKYLTAAQSAELILNKIRNFHGFENAIESGDEVHRTEIFEAVKDILPDMISSPRDFVIIFKHLTPGQSAELVHKKITNLDTFVASMLAYDQDNNSKIYEAVKEKLPEMINNDFYKIFKYLSPEQYVEVCLKKIKTAEEFNSALDPANEEQRTLIYEQLKNQLPEMVKGHDNFVKIIQYLTPKQCTEFSRMTIKTKDDFKKVSAQFSSLFYGKKENFDAVKKGYELNSLFSMGTKSSNVIIDSLHNFFMSKDTPEKHILKIYAAPLQKLNKFLMLDNDKMSDRDLERYKLAKLIKVVIRHFASSMEEETLCDHLETIIKELASENSFPLLTSNDRFEFLNIIEEVDQTRKEILRSTKQLNIEGTYSHPK
ncbi:MAG: ankyrin repeat domain-containing protein [Gammaproteobacteria bacterium]|nr:ankyrin repeat domain-containing protein [Gammaproteobacteria bacterium]